MIADTSHPILIRSRTRGVALLMVLIIVLAITIISTGFIARADIELACGRNMLLHTEIDHLADSALEHARGLLLHPQDVTDTYWTGDTGLQLVAGSSDYYDVNVVRDPMDYCNYTVTCEAYRLKDGAKTGQCLLAGVIRLDPSIGLWTLTDTTIRPNWVLHGDMRAQGQVVNQALKASLDGDVFATALSGNGCVGQTNAYASVSLDWPPVTDAYVNPSYTSTSVSGTLSTSSGLSRIWRCDGDLTLDGGVSREGMFLVTGDLTVAGSGVQIVAGKNLPALYVKGNLALEDADDFTVQGLTVVEGDMQIPADASGVTFVGGVCLGGTIRETTRDISGYDNKACVFGDPTWTTGAVDGALDLDGTLDYVQTPDSSSQLQLASDYTLSIWMKAAATQNDDAGVLVRCSPAGDAIHWGLQFNATSPKLLVVRHFGDGGDAWSTGITLAQIAGAWRHVAVTRSGTTMTSYLDGMQVATGTWTHASGIGDGHLNLGANATASADTLYAGAIDDVRIYDRALAAGEIVQVNAGVSIAGVIGHWPLNESGSSVTIQADPLGASIAAWPDGASDPAVHWSPAAGAFFRSIERK